ncbi:hypothetical protein CFP56_036354 [Quercus suber]
MRECISIHIGQAGI